MSEREQTLVVPIQLIRKDRVLTACLCLGQLSLADLLAKEKQMSVLHPQEKAYFKTLNASRRKASYLMGRYCAKQALLNQLKICKMHEILIGTGVFEQPIVCSPKTSGIQVSIAHSNELGCALAFEQAHPMGIDLETHNPTHSKVIDTQLTAQEKQLLHDKWHKKKDDYQYTWMWTVKEALSKVLKTGLTTPMSLYEISEFEYEAPYIIAKYKNFMQYKAMSFPWKDAIVTIALPKWTKIKLPDFL